MNKYKLFIYKFDDEVSLYLYDQDGKFIDEYVYEDFEINGKWASDFEEVELNGNELIDWGIDYEEWLEKIAKWTSKKEQL